LSRVIFAPSSSTTISWDRSACGTGKTYTFSEDKIFYSEKPFGEQEKRPAYLDSRSIRNFYKIIG